MSHETGIFFNVPADVYRRADGVNISSLKDMAISPAHYKAKVSEPPTEPTDAQVIGTITHSAVLENDFGGFVIKPKTYPKTIKGVTVQKKWNGNAKYCQEWEEDQTKEPIDQETATNIAGMASSIRRHPVASRVLYETQGHCEVSGWKIHEATGLLIKGRADRLTTDTNGLTVLVDLKTCQRGEASPEAFSKQIFNWKYHAQSAFYLDIFEASFFVFVCVEKESPYAVACYNLDTESLNLGRAENEKWLAQVKQCNQTGIWPAYGADLTQINIPQWAIKKAQ